MKLTQKAHYFTPKNEFENFDLKKRTKKWFCKVC